MKNRAFLFALCLSAYFRKGITEVETVWLKDVTTRMHTDKHTLSDPDLPDQLSFHLKLKSQEVNLNLKRNYQTDPNVDVYTVEILKDGLPILKKTHNLEKEDVAYYQDIENGAFMTARCVKRPSGQCDILINGNIRIGNRMYNLQPSEAQVTSRNFMEIGSHLGKQYVLQDQGRIQRKMSVENKEERNVNEKNIEEELIDRYRLIPDVQNKQKHFLHPDVKVPTRNVARLHNALATGENMYSRTNSKNDKIRNLMQYYVEVVVLTDSSIYDLFLAMAASSNSSHSHIEAIKKIKAYFSHVINGVDMLYRGIQESFIRINVILRALVILQTQAQFQHVRSRVETYRGMEIININDYLADLGTWDINIGSNQLPAYDQVILFTKYWMYDANVTDLANGLANKGGVCDMGQRVQVNRVGHYFLTVFAAAHELGHALGAEHDGSAEDTSCSSKDGYIMASSPPKFQPNKIYSRNPWLFSKCSVKAFTKTLKTKTCAKNKGEYSQAILTEWDTTMMKQPGELFTVNEQCHIILGNGSTYCGKMPGMICRFMYCTSPITGLCLDFYQTAATGTSCGINHWCNSEGLCVSKPSKLVQ